MIHKLLSKKRLKDGEIVTDRHEEFNRISFHKDYDRLIFSNAFRRLARKTQVHSLSKNDHVHNRLSHSLEVASVGRSLGLKAGEFLQHQDKTINPYDIAYIIQTACLAHDIGNPPFGHAGEEIIKEWFKKHEKKVFLKKLKKEEHLDFQHFDGNAQSFRIVSQLEHNLFNGGMRLTFATLGTLVKYPHSSKKCKKIGKSKFNFFKSEEKFFKTVFEDLHLIDKDKRYKRHPFSYLMEASDDICYGLLDLQDAIELKLIRFKDIKYIFRLLAKERAFKDIIANKSYSNSIKVEKLVADAINNLAEHTMEVFKENFDSLYHNTLEEESLIELFSNKNLKTGIEEAKSFAKKRIFNEKRKIILELEAYNIIETLLSNCILATYELYLKKEEKKLSFKSKRVLKLMNENKPKLDENLYVMYQRVLDYIVGMTDNYAKHIAGQLKGNI